MSASQPQDDDRKMSRRSVLKSLAAGGLAAPLAGALGNLPAALGDVAGVVPESVVAPEAAAAAGEAASALRLPAGWEAVAGNPNFKVLQAGNVICPTWSESRRTMVFIRRNGTDDTSIRVWNPETPMELADAEEFYSLFHYRSWSSPEELEQRLVGAGPWAIQVCQKGGEPIGVLTTLQAADLNPDGSVPDDWFCVGASTSDPAHLATFGRDEILRLVPELEQSFAELEGMYYHEPIDPSLAMVDMRYARLRLRGWDVQVGQQYDLDKLTAMFRPGEPIVRPVDHPFVRVPDSWMMFVDFGVGPGVVEIPNAETVVWRRVKSMTYGDEVEVGGKPSDVFPAEMLAEMEADNRQILAKVFLRKGGEGKYTYAGLGHMPADTWRPSLSLRVEPRMDLALYTAVTGDDAWLTTLVDLGRDELKPRRKVRSASDLTSMLRNFARIPEGSFELFRWAPACLTVYVLGDRCFATSVDVRKGKATLRHLIDDRFTGSVADEFALPAHWHQPPIAARTLHSRRIVDELIREFFESEGELPWSDRWKEDPFAEEPAAESESEDNVTSA